MVNQTTGLGRWLKDMCQKQHLSLREAAAKTGVSHATIRDIINGSSAAPETVRKLAQGFGRDGREKLALEDSLLVLAGYRTQRPEEEISVPLARLMDIAIQFDEPQLELMLHFAEFLGKMKER